MFIIRCLLIDDFYKGFFTCLSDLTNSPTPLLADFKAGVDILNRSEDREVVVIEKDNKIVATGSIFFERKFIRNLGLKAHIEDVVVLKKYRNEGFGAKIVNYLVSLAEKKKCYKIVLACKESNETFYKKCGFITNGLEMAKYL
ncbi:putative glucosamine 6-phosphate N-acetyltransferase 2 [Cucumispora dikerogammari]|nr:putative glucosamine 6-phosphate N-acetyltransferase 2 [Cucumispora dikerogammari]